MNSLDSLLIREQHEHEKKRTIRVKTEREKKIENVYRAKTATALLYVQCKRNI